VVTPRLIKNQSPITANRRGIVRKEFYIIVCEVLSPLIGEKAFKYKGDYRLEGVACVHVISVS
jgi:hypothetical protein